VLVVGATVIDGVEDPSLQLYVNVPAGEGLVVIVALEFVHVTV